METGTEKNREGSSGKTEEMRREKLDRFGKLIAESADIVFFGGAGVSTESGIPDFRSQDGLYHMQYEYPPETIISHHFFGSTRRNFTAFIKRKCCFRTPGRMPAISSLPGWKRRESSKR